MDKYEETLEDGIHFAVEKTKPAFFAIIDFITAMLDDMNRRFLAVFGSSHSSRPLRIIVLVAYYQLVSKYI